MRYETLIKVLDRIREEAPTQQSTRYRPDSSDLEKVNQARARAFLHLFLKVMFGITEFQQRERTITDGTSDGGIDAYHIDNESKTIYFLQAKFRINEKNFESKEILLEEILCMDVNRILDGDAADEQGIDYNGKIKQLQREVSQLPDIARYSYRVVILANVRITSSSKLKQLTGGYAAEVYDFEKTYKKLVFPVITGTYFAASDIVIPVDLSSKNAGSKISYNVRTKASDCEITVLFVPTIEIAKIMDKYRNAILKYNPRSYLELQGHQVNDAIRKTILSNDTNEFALFNNGITMLSEETNINEKIGQKNKAQLRIKNPQIINGGQTSFTLSLIYKAHKDRAEEVFGDKEVLLKIITLDSTGKEDARLELIDQISAATNTQTPVLNADRFANEEFHIEVQQIIFEQYGFLYERKRGEFSVGASDGYVDNENIIERNLFWRIYYSANGQIDIGKQKKLFQKNKFSNVDLKNKEKFDRAMSAWWVLKAMRKNISPYAPQDPTIYAKIFMFVELFHEKGKPPLSRDRVKNLIGPFNGHWSAFVERIKAKSPPKKKAYIGPGGEPMIKIGQITSFRYSEGLRKDLMAFIQDARSPAS
ncbi:MAG: AIPR family protein [Pseudomonadota bacterium]